MAAVATCRKRGAFILFEGVDRCGKTTQTARLADKLRGAGTPVELIRFPDRTTTIGKMIDAYLQNACELDDRSVHLLFSANRWEVASKIIDKLNKGITIVADRYAFSGVCYTAAKGGQSLEWCKGPDVGLPKPDIVFFLDIPMEEAAKRGDYGAERYEKEEFQAKVRQHFLSLADPDWKVLDATKSVDALHAIVHSLTTDVQAAVGMQPISSLWTDGIRD